MSTPMSTLIARSDYAQSILDLYRLVGWVTLFIGTAVWRASPSPAKCVNSYPWRATKIDPRAAVAANQRREWNWHFVDIVWILIFTLVYLIP